MLSDGGRRTLAAFGPLLWIGAGLMPMIGGAAKHAYRCRGREFTGRFDDCFNDYIPVAEIFAIFLAVITAYLFFRFARSLFMFSTTEQQAGYVAPVISKLTWPVAVFGAAWSLWRFFTYPLATEMLPFLGFWIAFFVWFVIGAFVGRADQQKPAA